MFVDDIIYDACVEHGLKLKMETLDWVCGIGGCQELGSVYFFNQCWKTGKNTRERKFVKWKVISNVYIIEMLLTILMFPNFMINL